MSRRARLSEQARRDLLAAVAWIAQERPRTAIEFRDAVRDALELVGSHPEAGRERRELTDQPVRFMAMRRFPYLIVYDTRPTPPMVVRIIHGARDLAEFFDEH